MLDRYVKLLKNGEVVAFPTETVYGLGADAWNPDAINRVFEIKGRPADNPLIIHVSDIKTVEDFAASITDDARLLMQEFWPGPLTLIFRKKPKVLDTITAGLDTVALRWPRHPLSQELIAQAGPLVAPSANSSGNPSPTKPEHIKEDFGQDFPVIEAGETDIGLESTVLDISSEPYCIYRPGAIGPKAIEGVVEKEITIAVDSNIETAAKSPGTKYSHYAPNAHVRWMDGNPTSEDTLYLLHTLDWETNPNNIIHYQRDYRKMAHELYDRFRQADLEGYQNVAIEPFEQNESSELIPALKNRVQKALSK